MNPFSGRAKCGGRVFATLATVAVFLLEAGCGFFNSGGGGGPQKFLNGSYSNSSLNGQYVFSLTGVTVNQAGTPDFYSETGVFKADGNGNLNVLVDDFNQSGQAFSSAVTGSYHINKDGTGFLIFNYNVKVNYQITMIDGSRIYLTEQDVFGSGSGFVEKQTTPIPATPSGTFVFKTHDLGITARVGAITVTSGNINGAEDLLAFGSTVGPNATPITGSIVAPPDVNGRGELILGDGADLNYYMVSPGKMRLLSATGATLDIGQAEAQTGGPFSDSTFAANSSYVFGSSGETNFAAGIHSAGVFTSNGNGTLASGTFDFVQDGSIFPDQQLQANNAGTYTIDASGRVLLTLNPQNGLANDKVMWLVSPSRAYFLVNNANTLEDGTASLQQGAPFSNGSLGSQCALVMDGFDVAFKDRVGAFLPDGNGNLKWSTLAVSFDPNTGIGTLGAQAFTNGTYQMSANGRFAVTVNNLLNPGNSSMVFYLTSSNSGFMLQEDQGFNIGGSFGVQSGQ